MSRRDDPARDPTAWTRRGRFRPGPGRPRRPLRDAIALAAGVAAAGGAAWAPPASGQGLRDGVVRGYVHERGSPPIDLAPPIAADLNLLVASIREENANRPAPELILREFVDEFSRENYRRAEAAARALVERSPERPLAHYNLACVLARQGRAAEAIDAFDAAIDAGWRDRVHVALDPDLDPIRDAPEFAITEAKLDDLIRREAIEPAPLRRDDAEAVRADVEAHVPAILERYHVPGAAVALVRDGRVAWCEAFGSLRASGPDATRVDSRFRLSAPGAILAALAALKLEEENVWSLDDSLAAWLPPIQDVAGGTPGALTLERALRHTAGLRSRAATVAFADGVDEEIRRRVRYDADLITGEPYFCPEAYLAVGRAVELALARLAGGLASGPNDAAAPTFAEYALGCFVRPLGMDRLTFAAPQHAAGGVATGHTRLGSPYLDALEPRTPAGPVHASVEDVARLVAYLAGGGEVGPTILDPSAIARLHDPAGSGGEDGVGGFGLGVRVDRTPEGRRAQIARVDRGTGSLLRWYPDAGCGVVVLFNSDTGLPAAERIAHLALGGR